MIIKPTPLADVYEIDNRIFEDHRGTFVKPFHWDTFKQHGLETCFKESFYSTSHKNVLRGMHYQIPPYDHAKLVYVIAGNIQDVAVDIRPDSETFGQYYATELSSGKANALYIGKGYAHGFLTLSESATVVYMTSTMHSPEHDRGVRWDSFGFDWGVNQPILSERDENHPHRAAMNVM